MHIRATAGAAVHHGIAAGECFIIKVAGAREGTRDALMWFMNGINTYSPDYQQMLNITGPMFEQDADASLRAFTNGILHEADINIADYNIESRELPISSPQPGVNVVGKEYTITTLHKVEDGRTYPLNLRDESNGTINLFFFAPIIKKAFETGEILCIDEFDESEASEARPDLLC